MSLNFHGGCRLNRYLITRQLLSVNGDRCIHTNQFCQSWQCVTIVHQRWRFWCVKTISTTQFASVCRPRLSKTNCQRVYYSVCTAASTYSPYFTFKGCRCIMQRHCWQLWVCAGCVKRSVVYLLTRWLVYSAHSSVLFADVSLVWTTASVPLVTSLLLFVWSTHKGVNWRWKYVTQYNNEDLSRLQ